jgi:antitoxin (DNA-binding transcriptional repressor) of toxin-antitoxin stability system
MKTATVRELRGQFPRLLGWLQAGETVAISRRGRVVARLVPPAAEKSEAVRLPDFAAQRRAILGNRRPRELPPSIVAVERESYDR